jgi:uncharacterized membrane protein
MAEETTRFSHDGRRATQSISVMRPREEVYAFWRNVENLTFMQGLESVRAIDATHSHWVAKPDEDTRVEWDSVIVREVPNELLEWQTVEGSELVSGGLVRFADAPQDKGTEIRVDLFYDVPGGGLAETFLKLWKEHPDQMVRADLRRFKQLLETGEIATIDGQPRG